VDTTIDDLVPEPGATIAVVGATDSPGKYGGKVYRDLKAKGFDVIAVNPGRAAVDGDPAVPKVTSLPRRPDLVVVVVPPQRTLEVLDECVEAGTTAVWLQPGSEDDAVLAHLQAGRFDAVVRECIMVRTRASA
jgi:predicted CoA-binding protein